MGCTGRGHEMGAQGQLSRIVPGFRVREWKHTASFKNKLMTNKLAHP